MNLFKNIVVWFVGPLAIIYTFMCGFLYFKQENIIFHPTKLPADHTFHFEQSFQEISIPAKDGKILNGVLVKSDSSKGLVFYLHGNGGAIDSWGAIAKTYTDLNYDIFILDYRGYGKSQGNISSEDELYSDVQAAYDQLKQRNDESKIVIIGYSIGTGPAAMLAASNNPHMLILQAPYYNLSDMMKHNYAFIPGFLLKYKFNTNEYIQKVKSPVIVFHGDKDEVIYYGSSEKLKENFKPGDKLIKIEGLGHNGMNDNETYKKELQSLLQ